MSLVADRLGHDYGELCALADVSVEAMPGAVTAVIGPNAAGKSTLLRCLTGALRPARGRVLIDGEPAQRLKAARLARRVAYVAQRPQVSAAFTVRQVVALGRYALPRDPRRVEEALADLDLLEIAERPFPALSVGQQQRVALARAVAQLGSGGHLVLDEPTAAMDLRHVQRCMALLRRLAGAGATVVTAVHDLPLAFSVADACWLLDGGRLAAAGPAGEVMQVKRLRAVFGVEFEWIRRDGRPPVLIAGAAGGVP